MNKPEERAFGENEIDLIIEENGILYPVEIKMTGNPKAAMGETVKEYRQKNISDINLEDYLGEYENLQATAESLFYDRFREHESLNGLQ